MSEQKKAQALDTIIRWLNEGATIQSESGKPDGVVMTDRGLEGLLITGAQAGLIAEPSKKQVYIFSDEHNAYWRPNGAGYTLDGIDAGIYDKDEAIRKTKHCGPEKRIRLIPVGTSAQQHEVNQGTP